MSDLPTYSSVTPGGVFDFTDEFSATAGTDGGTTGTAADKYIESVAVVTADDDLSATVTLTFNEPIVDPSDPDATLDNISFTLTYPSPTTIELTAQAILDDLNAYLGSTDISEGLIPDTIDRVADRIAAINTVNTRVTNEITARTGADSGLDNRISAIESAPYASQGFVNSAVSGEATTRSDADTALGTRIDNEISARTTADALKADISTTVVDTDVNLNGEGNIVSIDIAGVPHQIAAAEGTDLGDLTIPADDQVPTRDTDITSKGYVDGAITAGGSVVVDTGLTNAAQVNPVQGGALFTEFATKQDEITTFTEVPGLVTELATKQDNLTGTTDVPTLDTQLAAKQDNITGVSDTPGLQAALNAKQDVNIVVANEAARLALTPADYDQGELLLQVDTGEIYIVVGIGGSAIFHETNLLDVHLSDLRGTSAEGSNTVTSHVPVYTAARTDQQIAIETANRLDAETDIRQDFVAIERLLEASDEDPATTATQVYTVAAVDEITGGLMSQPLPSLAVEPSTFLEGYTYYNNVLNVIRYATVANDQSTFVTVAGLNDDFIASIANPTVQADGSLVYVATRAGGDTVTWVTQPGSTPTPGAATFTASIDPMTITQTSTATGVTPTVTLGVSGVGFTYTGFSNVAVTATNGVTYGVDSPSGSTATFDINGVISNQAVGSIIVTGNILYTNAASEALTHGFSVSARIVALAQHDHIFVGLESTTNFDSGDLIFYADTGTPAADGVTFDFNATGNSDTQHTYIAVPTDVIGTQVVGSGTAGRGLAYFRNQGIELFADDGDGWNRLDGTTLSTTDDTLPDNYQVFVVTGFNRQATLRLEVT